MDGEHLTTEQIVAIMDKTKLQVKIARDPGSKRWASWLEFDHGKRVDEFEGWMLGAIGAAIKTLSLLHNEMSAQLLAKAVDASIDRLDEEMKLEAIEEKIPEPPKKKEEAN